MNNYVLRYSLLALFTLFFSSELFVKIITTIFEWITLAIFSPFTTVLFEQGFLYVSGFGFDIIRACVAPSMYILFSIIFLSTPLEFKVLFKQLGLGLLLFTLFNLIRIIIMISITLVDPLLFDQLHFLFYEILSAAGFFVIGYFVIGPMREKKVFPIYSDIKRINERTKVTLF